MALTAKDARPGLGERYGVAVNASTLELEVGHESALDRVCEMGFARIGMAASAREESQRIAGELAPWLWRAAYGRDRSTGLAKACEMFGALLMLRPYMAEIERVYSGTVARFAQAVVHEWLELRCTACGGTGWQGVSATGKRVHAHTLGRNALKAICLVCRGGGRPKESRQLRIRALAAGERTIGEGEYAKLWRRQFTLARIELTQISQRPRDQLQAMKKLR